MDVSDFDFGNKVNLTDVEEGFCMADDDWDQQNSSTDLLLVGKILGNKSLNLDTVGTILSKAWCPVNGVTVNQVGEDRLVFSFKHKLDRKRALEGGPWSYEKRLVVLNSVGPEDNPSQVDLNWCDFIIHIKGLPLGKANKNMVEKICSQMGRFRIGIDVSKPIPRLMKIRNDRGDLIVVSFKFERLPNFCYYCGKLDHMAIHCKNRYDNEEEIKTEDLPYCR
ncbi:hypothetical protein ACJIZ3_013723 [Penstemon smallii]|uniref:CCHC-type domain-containing protein n=1 Tax=Penstemon smallii TaxID=265156 RepID=A0ABD3RHP8_9LAMI